MPIRSEIFQFECEGDRLVGDLYFPLGQVFGAIVATGPLTSVRHQASGAYARAMAARGFATLAFDHRMFGDSGGEPRQFENPNAKVQDIRAAAARLRADTRFSGKPIAALGICVGAGYMAKAVAEEMLIDAFAGVAGYYAHPTEESLARSRSAIARARAAEDLWRATGLVEYIPAVGPEGIDVAMPLPEAFEYYGTARGDTAGYVNSFAVQSRAYTIPFDALAAAAAIRVPTLLIHSHNALAPELAREFYGRLTIPAEIVWTTSSGQIDFYDDPKLIEPSAERIATFLTSHVGR